MLFLRIPYWYLRKDSRSRLHSGNLVRIEWFTQRCQKLLRFCLLIAHLLINEYHFSFISPVRMPRRKTPKPSKVATTSPQKQLCTNDTDSGNSSPARGTTSKTDRSADTTDWKDEIIHFYRNESIRAWVCYCGFNEATLSCTANFLSPVIVY